MSSTARKKNMKIWGNRAFRRMILRIWYKFFLVLIIFQGRKTSVDHRISLE
jgi:hypothetical protein